jgi:hypothetical protein
MADNPAVMTETIDKSAKSPQCRTALMVMMAVAAAVLLVSVGVRSVASWKHDGDLDHNSPGTWLCMAVDARDGMLYRPVVSEIGYGGTRYAPLFAVLIAGAMRAGMGPVAGGFVVGIGAVLVAIAGLYALLRKLGAPAAVAGAMAIFLIAADTTHSLILGIKCDLLPVGFTLWGLACVVWAAESRRVHLAMGAAAICFALALATKITSAFGVGTAIIWLVLARKPKLAGFLVVYWGIAMAIAGGIIEAGSHGRAGEILFASATGGGGLSHLTKGPMLLVKDIAAHDRPLLAFWVMAIALIAAARAWGSMPAILLVLATLGTMAIYGSPGTHSNHLVDMTAASILVLGAPSARRAVLQRCFWGVSTAVVLFAAVSCWRQAREIRRVDLAGQMQDVLHDAESSTSDGPILSEFPLIPVLAGVRPYMLDSFIFRALRARDPGIAGKLWFDLDHRAFRAVILRGPADDPRYSSDDDDFGPGFIQHMEQNYSLAAVEKGNFYVFLPKSR